MSRHPSCSWIPACSVSDCSTYTIAHSTTAKVKWWENPAREQRQLRNIIQVQTLILHPRYQNCNALEQRRYQRRTLELQEEMRHKRQCHDDLLHRIETFEEKRGDWCPQPVSYRHHKAPISNMAIASIIIYTIYTQLFIWMAEMFATNRSNCLRQYI